MKKILGTVIIICLIVFVVIAGNTKDKTTKKIGVIQYGDHQAWEDVKTGIFKSLLAQGYEQGKNIQIDLQNAHNDNSTMQSIAQSYANGNYDLVISFGTAPSQAILNLEKEKPIVFAAVTDPKSAGLVTDPNHPGGNITGTSDVTLYKESLELLKKLVPNAKKVGVLSNPGETNSVFSVNETKKYAADLGLEIVVVGVNNSGEVYQAAKSISKEVDAFYGIPDNTVTAGVESLIKATLESKKPLVAFLASDVEKGALASLGTDYIKVGEHTGKIIGEVLEGKNPGDISVQSITDADVFINTETAKAIDVTIPSEILKGAKISK